MTRLARVVVPGVPHHVIQRGNRRQQVFFSSDDYDTYLELMSEWCRKSGVEIWAYCLMPNHIHLIAVPERPDSLRAGIAEAHRRYSRMINFREDWRGHLWQGRFASYPMDEKHLCLAARYIELNPVSAGIVDLPEKYRWSSAKAHFSKMDDILVKVEPILQRFDSWPEFLKAGINNHQIETMKKHERTGRPLGDENFVRKLELSVNRTLTPKKPGPKPKPTN